MNTNMIKVLGNVASLLGVVCTLTITWATDQRQNAIIEEKVNEAMNRKASEENEDEE